MDPGLKYTEKDRQEDLERARRERLKRERELEAQEQIRHQQRLKKLYKTYSPILQAMAATPPNAVIVQAAHKPATQARAAQMRHNPHAAYQFTVYRTFFSAATAIHTKQGFPALAQAPTEATRRSFLQVFIARGKHVGLPITEDYLKPLFEHSNQKPLTWLEMLEAVHTYPHLSQPHEPYLANIVQQHTPQDINSYEKVLHFMTYEAQQYTNAVNAYFKAPPESVIQHYSFPLVTGVDDSWLNQHRGEWRLLTKLFQQYAPRDARDFLAYQATLAYCQGTSHHEEDWDTLAVIATTGQALTEGLSVDTLATQSPPEQRSPLKDAVYLKCQMPLAPWNQKTRQHARALQIQRWHAKTVALPVSPQALPAMTKQHLLLDERPHLREGEAVDTNAQAAKWFYTPANLFALQYYWTIRIATQTAFQRLTQDDSEEQAWEQLGQPIPWMQRERLRLLLSTLNDTQKLPKPLKIDTGIKDSWLETLEAAYQMCLNTGSTPQDRAFMTYALTLSPEHYTLATLEAYASRHQLAKEVDTMRLSTPATTNSAVSGEKIPVEEPHLFFLMLPNFIFQAEQPESLPLAPSADTLLLKRYNKSTLEKFQRLSQKTASKTTTAVDFRGFNLRNQQKTPMDMFFQALCHYPALEALFFSQTFFWSPPGTPREWAQWPSPLLDPLLKNLPYYSQLKTLSLENTNLNHYALERLCRAIWKGEYGYKPPLEILNLANNALTDESIKTLVSYYPWGHLKTLDLAGNLITNQGAHRLLNGLGERSALSCIHWGNSSAVSITLQEAIAHRLAENASIRAWQATLSLTAKLPLWFTWRKREWVLTLIKQEDKTAESSAASLSNSPRVEEVDEHGIALREHSEKTTESNSAQENLKTDEHSNAPIPSGNNTPLCPQASVTISLTLSPQLVEKLSQEETYEEFPSWDAMGKVFDDGAEVYDKHSRESGLSWKLVHGGSRSLYGDCRDFKIRSKTKLQNIADLLEEWKKLHEYFLKNTKSKLRDGSLDTPIVQGTIELLHTLSEDALAMLLREILAHISEKDALAAYHERIPFLLNTFPTYFPIRYPRYVERARLGLALREGHTIITQMTANMPPKPSSTQQIKQLKHELTTVKSDVKKLEEQMAILHQQWQCKLDHVTTQLQEDIQQLSKRLHRLEMDAKTAQQHIWSLQEAMHSMKFFVDNLQTHMRQTKESQEINSEALERLQEKINAQAQAIQTLQDAQPPIKNELSETEAAYVNHFKQVILRIYIAAMVISTGLFQPQASSTAGKAATIIGFLGNITPIVGSGMKILSSLLKTADSILLTRRMNHLLSLGGLFEVAALSENIALKLLSCLDLNNPVSDALLDRMLSAGAKLADALDSNNTVRSAFNQLAEIVLLDQVRTLFTQPTREPTVDRAEKDANLLIARVSEKGVPNQPFESQLLLYAAPLLAIADALFIQTLALFCTVQQRAQGTKDLICNGFKQKTFYHHVTQAWENHAPEMEERVTNPKKRNDFIQHMAERYATCTYLTQPRGAAVAMQAVGLFHFKVDRLKKNHVSMHEEALTLEMAETLLTAELKSV